MGNQSRYQKRANRRSVMLALAVVSLLAVIVSTKSTQLHQKNEECKQQITELERQMDLQEQRKQDLDQLSTYINTDQFKERIARDKLGLIYDDELILKKK